MQRKVLSREEIEVLKSKAPIAEVAQRLGLKIERNRCRCMFPERHKNGDRTPSMSIDSQNGLFKCWVCFDVKGDVLQLVRLFYNCSFQHAVQWLAQYYAPEFLMTEQNPSQLRKQYTPVEPLTRPKLLVDRGADVDPKQRLDLLQYFYSLLDEINGACLKYFVKRKIFKNTLDAIGVRQVSNYHYIHDEMKKKYSIDLLMAVGLFSAKGYLRYLKHPVIFPYFDSENRLAYFQARAIEPDVKPKELNLKGQIPCPFHLKALLNPVNRTIFLCEGVVDTLTLLQQKIVAVGVPGVQNFKKAWVEHFRGKKVFITFDNDPAGQLGAEKIQNLLNQENISSKIIKLPGEQTDVNDLFRLG